jgi:hypothetical protein
MHGKSKRKPKGASSSESGHGNVAIGLSEVGDNADSYDEYDLVAGAFACIASTAIEKTPKVTLNSHERFILNGLHGEVTSTAQFGKATLKKSCPFYLAAMRAMRGLQNAGFRLSLNEEADVFTITRGHELHTFSEREDSLFHLSTANPQSKSSTLDHPGDDALCAKLGHGGILSCHVTSRDVRAARTLQGPCVVCQVGKTRSRSAPNPPIPTTQAPGALMHVDRDLGTQ